MAFGLRRFAVMRRKSPPFLGAHRHTSQSAGRRAAAPQCKPYTRPGRRVRMPNGNSGDLVRIGAWIANPVLDTISCGTEIHKLEPQTMRLLLYLANSAGAVVSVDQLLSDVWSGVVVGSA